MVSAINTWNCFAISCRRTRSELQPRGKAMTNPSGTLLADKCRPTRRDAWTVPRNPFRLTVIALTFTLSGCITPPKLDPQQQPIVNDRLGLSSQVSAPRLAQAWWVSFNDP